MCVEFVFFYRPFRMLLLMLFYGVDIVIVFFFGFSLCLLAVMMVANNC